MKKELMGLALAAVVCGAAAGEAGTSAKRFEWTTASATARQKLLEVQQRIEDFQFGAETVEAARQIVAADPQFAMGEYYLSAVMPAPDNQAHLDKAIQLYPRASDGERRFIEAMVIARANQGANFQDAAPLQYNVGGTQLLS